MRHFAILGSVLAMLAVASGAFGAHALRARVEPRMLEVWETASRYQMYHALGLLVVAWLISQLGEPSRATQISGWSFVVGIALFSGSLYAMVLSGVRGLGAITPVGGLAFIVGWLALAWAASRLG